MLDHKVTTLNCGRSYWGSFPKHRPLLLCCCVRVELPMSSPTSAVTGLDVGLLVALKWLTAFVWPFPLSRCARCPLACLFIYFSEKSVWMSSSLSVELFVFLLWRNNSPLCVPQSGLLLDIWLTAFLLLRSHFAYSILWSTEVSDFDETQSSVDLLFSFCWGGGHAFPSYVKNFLSIPKLWRCVFF